MAEPYSYDDVKLRDTTRWTTPDGTTIEGVVHRKNRISGRERIYDLDGVILYDSKTGGTVVITRRRKITEPTQLGAVVTGFDTNWVGDRFYVRVAPGKKGWLPLQGDLFSFDDLPDDVKVVE